MFVFGIVSEQVRETIELFLKRAKTRDRRTSLTADMGLRFCGA